MLAPSANPPLSPAVRLVALLIALVLLVGATQLVIPAVMGPIWPWVTTPFNARFLGAVYLAQLMAMGALLVVNRAAPGRMVLLLALVFVVVVLGVSLLWLGRFEAGRWGTWAWFLLYGLSVPALALLLWRHWSDRPAARPLPGPWRLVLAGQGAALAGYGLALLAAPTAAAAFWPWPVDALHGQVYSALFIVGGLGGLLLAARGATAPDLLALGLSQLVFGLAAIAGMLLADATARRIEWAAGGTWAWLLLLVLVAAGGAAMLWLARRLLAPRSAAGAV